MQKLLSLPLKQIMIWKSQLLLLKHDNNLEKDAKWSSKRCHFFQIFVSPFSWRWNGSKRIWSYRATQKSRWRRRSQHIVTLSSFEDFRHNMTLEITHAWRRTCLEAQSKLLLLLLLLLLLPKKEQTSNIFDSHFLTSMKTLTPPSSHLLNRFSIPCVSGI